MKNQIFIFLIGLAQSFYDIIEIIQITIFVGLMIYGMYLVSRVLNISMIWLILSLLFGFTMFIFAFYPIAHHAILFFKNGSSFKLPKKVSEIGFSFKTKNGKVNLDNPFRGIYIQGGAGSGKSKSLFEPIIDQMVQKSYTGILYDFKSPELTRHVYAAAEKYNTEVKYYFVDFREASKSHRINPLDPKYLTKTAYAFEFSKALINNLLPETVAKQDFWGRNAQSILAGLIWYMRNQHPKYCTLPHIISLLLHSNIEKLLTKVNEDPVAGGMIVSLVQAIERGAEKQVAGVLSTLQNALSTLNTADIFWILSGNDLNLNLNDPASPKFLSIGNESSLAETYAPVISLIIAVSSKMMNVPNRQQSVIMLDEAPTIYIPNFEQIPATGRSNKIATIFGAQDISQINDKYGREKSQVIISNLGNQFYGRTTNSNSAKMIKEIFGTHETRMWSKSRSKSTSGTSLFGGKSSRSKSKSEKIQEMDKIRAEDITQLNSGQFFGILAEGNKKELLGVQFKPFLSKEIDFRVKGATANELDIERNYKRIIEEVKNLFENDIKTVNSKSKSRNKYLNLDF
ncbi:type IV secretion system DNA-binding domain-containing protein [Maribacter sp. M208]|uniref:type IV secretory system conjugative DNA transfer family protein n=1 Tax=Maribacter huludaoensis TaxID=3030010 RepID=UPI0023EC1EF0|nr:type IV secretory system conjugative DNA transfer family protein [Maribacter huludaoensis]MDF4221079.1 type IV secretion system DNA-binding domain-containing protein [Maribacter huludaoensis]